MAGMIELARSEEEHGDRLAPEQDPEHAALRKAGDIREARLCMAPRADIVT